MSPPSSSPEVMKTVLTDALQGASLTSPEVMQLKRELRSVTQREKDIIGRLKRATVCNKKSKVWIAAQVQLYKNLSTVFRSIVIHSPNQIVALTEPINITHQGRIYHLGSYRLTLNGGSLRRGTRRIAISSFGEEVENESGEYIHPSVNNRGNVCWGKKEGILLGLVKRQSYVEALLILDKWLHTYGSDPLTDIGDWRSTRC